jgi:excinuclease ABC subunit A
MSDTIKPNSKTQKFITIKGANTHNLKKVNVKIPKKKMVVITGVSGSGKSSLAFDTLFAEGQRRYIESLSSYARQFLGKLQKPDVEKIDGISPAIAIEQKVNSKNPRSTVGTSTEIYDYLKLLFARVGKTISPISKQEVKKQSVTDVVNFFKNIEKGKKALILFKKTEDLPLIEYLNKIFNQGYSRVLINEEIHRIEYLLENENLLSGEELYIVIDRVVTNNDEDNLNRIADSTQSAFFEGKGQCFIKIDNKITPFSNRFEKDGIKFILPTEHLFSFNNPLGSCKKCDGYGSVLGIDENKVIPNTSLSVYDGAVNCWNGEKLSKWKERFTLNALNHDFPIHRAYNDLNEDERNLLWNGAKKLKGINAFFKQIEKENYKVQNRVLIARYKGKSTCDQCKGSRLRKEALYVYIDDMNINDIVHLPIDKALEKLKNLKLNKNDAKIADRILKEITNRLNFLNEVGLNYLSLNRLSSTLSGGESQRINLATSIGSSLVGSMYILDEPSIGLHSRDTKRLIKVLESLRDIGNTVIIVEHDEEIMFAADEIIDIGVYAGSLGGQIVFQGNLKDIYNSKESLTGQYLSGTKNIDLPSQRKKWTNSITIKGARENNLQNIDVEFPLDCLTLVTGVSGSGKTSLIKQILFPAIQKNIKGYSSKIGSHDKIEGDLNLIENIEFIDQNPIGRSSRSNPVTYIKAYDDIRSLFSSLELSKTRGYKSGRFSFNVDGGRCEVCEGEGQITIEMQFMADVYINCENCNGKRFKEETLEIKYKNKNISDVLNMTINEALSFFEKHQQHKIVKKLLPLQQVGLGYIQLGQSSNTLSGGEAQRIKLAFFLSKGTNTEKTLFIFDEPTTGLHFHDISKLLTSFKALINNGHTIVCIEHNIDVIKSADWIIDLGPEGGAKGGELIFYGTPEELIKNKKSHTAFFLKEKLASTV